LQGLQRDGQAGTAEAGVADGQQQDQAQRGSGGRNL
jgi:hypothetical protein